MNKIYGNELIRMLQTNGIYAFKKNARENKKILMNARRKEKRRIYYK